MSRGFTLIELIVYIALMSIVFGALASLVVSGNRGVTGREQVDDVYVAQARIMKSIRDDVDDSSSVSAPGGNLQLATSGGSVTYTVAGGEFRRGADVISPPSVVVSDFSAEVFNSKGVSVSMRLTHVDDSEEVLYIENAFVLYE
ncbi:MAG: type II secretion system protein [Patescibacteria group bacterium UBA2103]